MRIVALSDTHGLHRQVEVPDGDCLIFAGDACNYGTLTELADFGAWWRALPHRHKVFVAGNHDWPFQRSLNAAVDCLGPKTHYLCDDGVTIDGWTIYGSPWQPEFCGWAFNLPRDGWELKAKWERIPQNIDILVTHGPPSGSVGVLPLGEDVGDALLRQHVERASPLWHFCGHIHSGAREAKIGGTLVRNVSICDEGYNAARPAFTVMTERAADW